MRESPIGLLTQGNIRNRLARATGRRPGNPLPPKETDGISRSQFCRQGVASLLALAVGCTNDKKLPPKIASVLDKNGYFRPVEDLYKLMDNLLINLSHETDAKPHLVEHIPELQDEIGEFLNAKTLKDKDESLEYLNEILLKHRDFMDHLGLHAIYFAIKAKKAGLTSLKDESLTAVLNLETSSNEYYELVKAVRMFSDSFDKAIRRSDFASYDPIESRLNLLGLGVVNEKFLIRLSSTLNQKLESTEEKEPLPEIKPPPEAPRKSQPSPPPVGQLA